MSLAAVAADRLLAFVLIALVAALFGATAESDTYFLALVIPTAIGAGLSEALYAVLVPRFSRDAEDGTSSFESAWRAAGAFSVALSVAYALVVLVISPEEVTVWLLLAPTIFSLTLSGVYAAALVVAKRYALAVARVPLATAVGLAIVAMLAPVWPSVRLVAAASTLGSLATLLLLAYLYRKGVPHGKARLVRVDGRRLAASSGSAFASTVTSGPLFIVVERLLAAGLAAGSISLLTFARNLALLPLLISAALANGIFPSAAAQHARVHPAGVAHLVERTLCIAVTTSACAAAWLAVCRSEIVFLALQRGAIGPAEANATADLLLIFPWATIGLAVAAVSARVLFAVGRFAAVAAVSGFAIATYVGLAIPLSASQGREGLAYSFVGSTVVAAAASYVALSRAVLLRFRVGTVGGIAIVALAFAAGAYAGWKAAPTGQAIWPAIVRITLSAVGGGAAGVLAMVASGVGKRLRGVPGEETVELQDVPCPRVAEAGVDRNELEPRPVEVADHVCDEALLRVDRDER